MILKRPTTPVRITLLAWYVLRVYKVKWGTDIIIDEHNLLTLNMYDHYYHKFLAQRLPGEAVYDTIIRKLLPRGEAKLKQTSWGQTLIAIMLSASAAAVIVAMLIF